MKTVEITRTNEYQPKNDFIRVASATPEVAVADVATNTDRIEQLYIEAASEDVSLVVFPEMSITGYSIGDLVQGTKLLDQTVQSLVYLSQQTLDKNCAMVVGLPLRVGNAIYNCAALLADGEIKGVVPKQNLPTYKEFYEKRWYQAWDERDNIKLKIGEQNVTFGRNQIFEVAGSKIGIEICEDLWVADSPNLKLAKNGSTIIANPSASPEHAAKRDYRSKLVGFTAAKLLVGYIYAGADQTESTMDIVMSGHAIISEAGRTLTERRPFSRDKNRLAIADIDLQHLSRDRQVDNNYPNYFEINPTATNVQAEQDDLRRAVEPYPFIPKGTPEQIAERLDEILAVQSVGLAERFVASRREKMIVGLSGGLDSTLALMVMMQVADRLGRDPGDIIEAITMPAKANSTRTQSNAEKLARALGIYWQEIPISDLAQSQLEALNNGDSEDITFENTHARIRTALLFNRANQTDGMVIGTGDLSEIALGWCTFNGDHISQYNPNASIPKTLVRSLVAHAANSVSDKAKTIINDILDTPVSPELTGNGNLDQKTESILGSYDLHDFFLFHMIRHAESPEKIAYMARKAFADKFDDNEIMSTFAIFIKRFYQNQWKRSVMPDGPKVGSVSLSPRGDWRMPSDMRGLVL